MPRPTPAATDADRWELGYRPALDGLRGVAVLLVIGGHAHVPGFMGSGHVGVTIFFVLSGFLITTLLLEERRRTGRISPLAFYARRARRLLPALGLLLIVMALIGVSSSTLLSAALYYANVQVILAGNINPLEHLWSLSVEEHFYLVWPIALAMLAGRRLFIPVTVVGILIAMALRVGSWVLTGDRELTFFLTLMRADAILAGCLLAVIFQRRAIVPPAAAVLLAVALGVTASFVGGGAFLAVFGLPLATIAGVVLVAWAATDGAGALAWRPLAYVGSISYGLYLWQGVATYYGWVSGRVEVMVMLVALAGLMAAASYRYVERPLLRSRRVQRALQPVRASPAPAAQTASAS